MKLWIRTIILCCLAVILFALSSCEVKQQLHEGENIIQPTQGSYQIKICSNSDYVTVGLSMENFPAYLTPDMILSQPSVVNATIYPCAHDEIQSVDDILDGHFWYYAEAIDGSHSEMKPETKTYLDESNMLSMYFVKIMFTCSLSEDTPDGEYALKVDDIEFPEYNAFSVILVGEDDFVEFNSVGNNARSNTILVNHLTPENSTITAYVYIDGNDERVTVENLSSLSSQNGEIVIRINLIENEINNEKETQQE